MGASAYMGVARYIHQECMRSEFWEKIEEPSQDMYNVAFHVFDRYGTLKTKRGTGVWGDELDYGPLFLIECHGSIPSLNIRALSTADGAISSPTIRIPNCFTMLGYCNNSQTNSQAFSTRGQYSYFESVRHASA
ncbi:hypothetical protein C8Q69DRAFT_129016 [Paecilomyces variotii]|uniref:Uncharacterized protein n=1 Tax=Byssochlamys spectabilis TaxID=264951 RepID=A0A443HID8_BYSSP|nr:hypothetical protein C8Q69DRAFT_129016 [Paecilomyces variotii]RWQ91588.1 hypothetical protein C8Q69DRAFT_129016 [Paecilomyces variotii]